jgi:transposase-like protein
VSEYTVEKLAGELELDTSQVYRWVRGDTRLPTQKAIEISEIARSAGTALTLEDLYETDIVRVRCRMRSRSRSSL